MSGNAQALDTGPIERREFRPGAASPSAAKLNETFGVSRTAARASHERLEHKGRITRRSRRGSIARGSRVEQPLQSRADRYQFRVDRVRP